MKMASHEAANESEIWLGASLFNFSLCFDIFPVAKQSNKSQSTLSKVPKFCFMWCQTTSGGFGAEGENSLKCSVEIRGLPEVVDQSKNV